MDAWLQIRCSQISGSEDESSALEGRNCTQRTRRLKMLCSSCLLPLLALYLLPEEASSAALPSSVRNKREMDWLDQELLSHMHEPSDQGDLSVGDAGDMDRDMERRPPHSETLLTPTERIHNQNLNQNHNQNQNLNHNQNLNQNHNQNQNLNHNLNLNQNQNLNHNQNLNQNHNQNQNLNHNLNLNQNQNLNHNQNLNQLLRKANEKRRKIVPVDSIGSFQMSSFRNRKDEPDVYWEELEE